LVLKAWNKTLGDKHDRLNSFSICLLLLGFLIKKQYLPNLQALATSSKHISWTSQKKRNKSASDYIIKECTAKIAFLNAETEMEEIESQLKLNGSLEVILKNHSKSADELLVEFFKYYGETFRPDDNMIDIS
jgi:hypothetical protein